MRALGGERKTSFYLFETPEQLTKTPRVKQAEKARLRSNRAQLILKARLVWTNLKNLPVIGTPNGTPNGTPMGETLEDSRFAETRTGLLTADCEFGINTV